VADDAVPVSRWALDPAARHALRREAVLTALRARDVARAIVECEELLDDQPDDVEVLGWLAALFTENGDVTAALEAWRSVVELSEGQDAAALAQLAVSAFGCCRLEEAAEAARAAIARSDVAAEAHHVLGLVTERTESAAAAFPHFLAAWRAAPVAFPLPAPLSEADARLAVDEALRALEPSLRRFWRKVPLRLEAWPDLEELARAAPPLSPRVVALYAGPPPARADGSERPEALRVFLGNLAHAIDLDDAIEQLVDALVGEAEDWLGTPDDAGPPR
jgi:tetratricopeptide (TPR) repeat protein